MLVCTYAGHNHSLLPQPAVPGPRSSDLRPRDPLRILPMGSETGAQLPRNRGAWKKVPARNDVCCR